MKTAPVLLAVLTALFATLSPLAVDAEVTPKYTIDNPNTAPQAGTQQGYSVAVGDGITVVGSPADDLGGKDSGVVKVYNTSTGTLVNVLVSPSGVIAAGFGTSVAVSGKRVVVGSPLDQVGAIRAGSVYVFDLASATPTSPVAHFSNPIPESAHQFGQCVAISGSHVLVGKDNIGGAETGNAWVYDLAGPTPTVPVATLSNPNSAPGDRFGCAVAINGTIAVIGSAGENTGATAAGRAYVYDLASATSAVPTITLNNPGPGYDDFGNSVAVSGTVVVVGALADDTGATDAGSAYVYDLASATPTVPVATLNNPNPGVNDYFGRSVAANGSRVVVGADSSDTAGSDAGIAYVYDLSSATPSVPVATLNNPTPASAEFFGFAVATRGTQIVVGAFGDSTAATWSGSAYVFDVAGETPTAPIATLNSSSPTVDNKFGRSVAVSGSLLAIGAPGDDQGSSNLGSVHVYDLSTATPTVPLAVLKSPNPSPYAGFGYSVSMSETKLVVGSIGMQTSAYVYELAGETPSVPIATLDDPSPAPSDKFSFSVAVSGTRVVVGAFLNDTGATDAGRAYVYDLASATPSVPVATLNNPTPAQSDQFGYSVALSGALAFIGSPHDENDGSRGGSVQVYDLSSATPTEPVAILKNPSPTTRRSFGASVAANGARVVVGAPDTVGGAAYPGGAYVYDFSGGMPTAPAATLTNPNPTAYDSFGGALAISGTHVVVGACRADSGGTDAGIAYVYDLASANLTAPIATLNNPDPQVGDQFGTAVAIDGGTVVNGAAYADGINRDRGSAYVYNFTPPAGGSFTFTPSSQLKPTTVITATFSDWTDADQPLTYEVREGATVIVQAGNNAAPTFSLTAGTHTVSGRIYDSLGNYADVGPMTVVIDDLTPPAGGSFALTYLPSFGGPMKSMTATFSNWTDVDQPLAYEVREGATVIAPAGSNAVPTFSLSVGTHLVSGRIYDSLGNYTDAGPITVIVDGSAPTITKPDNISVYAPTSAGTPVNFSASAVDDIDPNPTVTANPPSGSTFPLGTTTVTVTAQDDAGNVATDHFDVNVVPGYVRHSSLFSTGGEVSNAGTDARIQGGATWSGFGPPAINNAGKVAYIGKWKAAAVTGANPLPAQSGTGIFVDDSLIAKVGEAVGGLGGVKFKAFKNPVIDDAGHVAFIATIAGTGVNAGSDTVVISNGRTGALEVIAREGSTAEGAEGARFQRFMSVSIQGDTIGETVFTATLQPGSGNPAVTARNDAGAWWLPAGESSAIKLIREGDSFGAEKIKSFLLLNALGGSPGHGRGQSGNVQALLRLSLMGGTAPRQVQALAEPGTLTEIAGTGDALDGVTLPNAIWSSMSLPSSGNGGASISTFGTLTQGVEGVTSTNARGIFVSADRGAKWEPLARAGDPAPGMGAGAKFEDFKDPVNSSTSPALAFIGMAEGGTVMNATNDGIWFSPDGIHLELIAREGELLDGVSAEAKWKRFVSLALPGGRTGPLFTAFLGSAPASTGGDAGKSGFGLYGVDRRGLLFELIRENQPLLGKTVKSFHVLEAVGGSVGVTRSFNANAQVAALVEFTDKTNAIVRVDVP